MLAGQALTYTINVNNAGPSTAHGVTVVDALPSGVTPGRASGRLQRYEHDHVRARRYRRGRLTPFVLPVNVAPGTRGSLVNNATVTTSDFDPSLGNNTASANTTVNARADVSITKADTPDPVIAGSRCRTAFKCPTPDPRLRPESSSPTRCPRASP